MYVVDFIKSWPCIVKGSIQTEVKTITERVEDVAENTLFFARKGTLHNNLDKINIAIEKGATAVVVEDEEFFRTTHLPITFIWVPNILKMMANCAAIFYGMPSEAISVIAVTGTNGKTTTTHFIEQLLRGTGYKTLLIGTNGIFKNGRLVEESSYTTLDAISFQQKLAQAVEEQIDYCIVEASSQGLAMYRLESTSIKIGVFLNLGEDHLEWHRSLENYKQAKLKLLALCEKIVVNHEDSFCKTVGILTRKDVTSFGRSEKCNLYYEKIMQPLTQNYLVQVNDKSTVFSFPFAGDYNVENAIAAVAVCNLLNIKMEQLELTSRTFKLPQGRLQKYEHPNGFSIIIDYAHTPDALNALLHTIAQQMYNHIILVFGCGGNRDRGKRSKMGAVASKFSHIIILTTDNCRDELPQNINAQIREGFNGDEQVFEYFNRQEAIWEAVKIAQLNDVIVIVGKGHEQTQVIGDTIQDLSDSEIVEQLLECKRTKEK